MRRSRLCLGVRVVGLVLRSLERNLIILRKRGKLRFRKRLRRRVNRKSKLVSFKLINRLVLIFRVSRNKLKICMRLRVGRNVIKI